MIGQPGQDVGKPSLRIDFVHLAGFDQGIDGGGTMAASVRTGKGPVSSSNRHTPQRSFVSGLLTAPCGGFDKSADVDRFNGIGSHIWSTIYLTLRGRAAE